MMLSGEGRRSSSEAGAPHHPRLPAPQAAGKERVPVAKPAARRTGLRLERGHGCSTLHRPVLTENSRRGRVKLRLVYLQQASGKSTAQHIRYIVREGVGRELLPYLGSNYLFAYRGRDITSPNTYCDNQPLRFRREAQLGWVATSTTILPVTPPASIKAWAWADWARLKRMSCNIGRSWPASHKAATSLRT